MRILHLTLDLPYPPVAGAQVRDLALISRLAARHEIDLVAFCETAPRPGAVAEMERICRSVSVITRPALGPAGLAAHIARQSLKGRPIACANYVFPEVEARLRALVAERRPHILQIEHSFLAPYVEAAGGARTVLSLHNVGAIQHARIAALPGPWRQRLAEKAKSALMQRWEGAWVDRFDLSVAMSEDDAAALRGLGTRGRVEVIPNGVDCKRLSPPPAGGSPALLFLGNLSYLPNIDAVRFFAREVLPLVREALPEARFLVAGRSPRPDLLAGIDPDGIEIIADPPEIYPIYARATAAVVPLRAGGGTRHKILEAMAARRPVVSTALGAEGLGAAHEKTALIAEKPEEIAEAVIRLDRDQALADRLTEAARRFVETRYDWDRLASRLEALYETLAPAERDMVVR